MSGTSAVQLSLTCILTTIDRSLLRVVNWLDCQIGRTGQDADNLTFLAVVNRQVLRLCCNYPWCEKRNVHCAGSRVKLLYWSVLYRHYHECSQSHKVLEKDSKRGVRRGRVE